MASHHHDSAQPIELCSNCNHQHKQAWWPLVLAGLAAIASEAIHWLELDWTYSAALAVLAIIFSGISTYKSGLVEILHGKLNINALMTIAVTGAVIIGQWPEAAMVMVLYAIAERIEHSSLDKAHQAIKTLLQLSPETASVEQADGSWQETALDHIAIGSNIRVRPGERIALDGIIIAGETTIDQSPLTGESLPVEKAINDSVYAGSINGTGSFVYTANTTAGESTVARIIQAIETAQQAKAPTERLIDKFSRIYTPLVVLLALSIALIPPLLLGADWYDWVYKALVLLVIACPCALVISTPVTIVSALAKAARFGVLIKGGSYLELGRKLKWIAFDKTGTITWGKPELTDHIILPGCDPVFSHSVAGALAGESDHPVSKAIAQGLFGKDSDDADPIQQNIQRLKINRFTALPGRGVQGQYENQTYVLANHRHIHENGLCSEQLETQLHKLESQGKTVVLLADTNQVHAIYAVADTIKPNSAQAMHDLHQIRVKTAILSGDNSHTVAAIAKQAGIDQALGDQLPEDKLNAIDQQSQSGITVGMVGDGINDAPALARADIGFAMGSIGTDTAIETANIAIMDDDLRKIPWFIKLSRTTHKVLLQNFTIALGLKLIFVILTIMNLATMWMAVFADVGASLIVIFNGLRLLRRD